MSPHCGRSALLPLFLGLLRFAVGAQKQTSSSVEPAVHSLAFTCSQSEEELQLLFRENLDPDFAPWRAKKLTMASLDALIKQFPTTDTRRVAMIYKNQLFFPLQKDPTQCAQPCNRYLEDTVKAFRVWNATIQFPDTVFVLSVWDQYLCEGDKTCAAPIMSIAKQVGHPTRPDALDILIPKPPTKQEAYMVEFPWHLKSNKAVWRGTRWCDFGRPNAPVNCSRFYMADLMSKPNMQALFDFGYVAGDESTPLVPHMDHSAFSRYKFLLNLDGFTAAYRLSKLMLVNSVVLKEESHRAEYYYRSLKPYQHYIPIFKTGPTDVVDVLKQYQKPEKDAEVKRIAKDAQMFAARYACPSARMLYWRKVLVEFKKLFPDMDQAIKDKWLPLLQKNLGRKP